MTCMRVLAFFQSQNQQESLRKATERFWYSYWVENKDISSNDVIIQELVNIGIPAKEAQGIVSQKSQDEQAKHQFEENTNQAIQLGAFGAPFLLVTKKDGKQDTFFGSDRFHHIAMFLNESYDFQPVGKL